MLDIQFACNVQEESTGIQWVENLNWQQIKEKAKTENKYIFIDCYATWCTICKKMDADVFSKQAVGDFFTERFIAVKVQMDVTKNDPPFVKEWYQEAERLQNEYFVFSFPTLLFLNPQGDIVEKTTGFKEKNELLSIAQAAILPDKKFEDPYKKFLILKDRYQKGIKDYNYFPYMITVAKEIGQRQYSLDLVNELSQHLLTLSNKELLNRDYIQFINEYEYIGSKNVDNNLSRIFFKEGKKVDALMQVEHYSRHALNSMIRRGYVRQFLEKATSKGLQQSHSDSIGIYDNELSVPWINLHKDIAEQFNAEIAEQNVLWAKIRYFDYYRDPRTLSHFIAFTRKYGVESLFMDPDNRDYFINYIAWIYCVVCESNPNDTKYLSELLKESIEHSIVREKKQNRCLPFEYVDTYAHLLYKMGEHEKAIKNQLDAINIYLDCAGGSMGDKQHQMMLNQLSKMQNGLANFSGNWVLNPEKTQFNETPGKPAAAKLYVDHKSGYIILQRNDRPKENLKIDSTVFIEIIDGNSKIQVSIKPTDDKQGLLETRIYNYPQGNTSVMAAKKTRIWRLSADKSTLTVQEHIETTREGLNFDMMLVYERQ